MTFEKQNDLPEISVIVPSYNHGEFISETLNSIINQTFSKWECIIVDDGSSDNTRQVIQEYCDKDSRFEYVYQNNSGVSAARNNGISLAKGEFILPLDADDLIGETYIEKALLEFRRNPDLKLVYCKAKMFGKVNKIWELPDYCYEKLLWQNLIFCSAVYRKSDFNKTKGYDTNILGYEDWDFWLSFIEPSDSVFCINEVLFYYRIRKLSRSTGANQNCVSINKYIYIKHESLYKPFLPDIINYHNGIYLISDIKKSLSYRIGYIILEPFRFVKKIIQAIFFH